VSQLPLTVYVSRPAAPLCERVFDYLDRRGYDYTTVDVVSDEDRETMRQRTGFGSCPLVVIGDHVVGKLEDTIAADRSGRLRELLDGASA
jgi:glutaredoxin